jgi:hypothetical protein
MPCGAVHQEFVWWFGADTAGPQEHYAQIASEIWQLWERYRDVDRVITPDL